MRLGLVLLLLLPGLALAHPISQAALDVDVSPTGLHVRARVPVEEIFVANAFGAGSAATLADAWKEHGEYFLRHFTISADGRDLTGHVTTVAESGPEHVAYDLDYPLAAAPAQLTLRQDLLNEFLFAPGNPWEATFVVRVTDGGRVVHEGLLLASRASLVVDVRAAGIGSADRPDRARMFAEYLRHGVVHILGGYDHLLFITALVLATVTFWDLVKVISAFTLAHSITLTLSVLDIVRLPQHVVEPMIAASIVFVAMSNVLWPTRTRGWMRLATAFFFGLFHGLGFAGGLLDAMAGMPATTVGIAIVAFSLGVEIGHQVVVLPLFGALKLARATRSGEASRDRLSLVAMRAGSALIAVAGVVYLVAALR